MIDKKSKQILAIVQSQPLTSNVDIAARVGLTKTAVYERIRKLQEQGIIRGYETRLDPKALGLGQVAFIFVRADEDVGSLKTGAQLAKIPEVLEVHHIAGEDCYLIKVRVRDTASLGDLLRHKLGKIKAIRSTRTTICFSTLKETLCLPLDSIQEDEHE